MRCTASGALSLRSKVPVSFSLQSPGQSPHSALADGSQAVWTSKVLVAATGQEASPLRPSWPTMAQYTGRMLHASVRAWG